MRAAARAAESARTFELLSSEMDRTYCIRNCMNLWSSNLETMFFFCQQKHRKARMTGTEHKNNIEGNFVAYGSCHFIFGSYRFVVIQKGYYLGRFSRPLFHPLFHHDIRNFGRYWQERPWISIEGDWINGLVLRILPSLTNTSHSQRKPHSFTRNFRKTLFKASDKRKLVPRYFFFSLSSVWNFQG